MIQLVLVTWRGRAVGWFVQRAPREQLLLAILAALALTTLLVGAVWRPMMAARAEARADIRAYDALIAQLRVAGTPAPGGSGVVGPASTRIANSAAMAGLSIRRLEPEGASTRVVIEEAEFAKVLPWLEAVERDAGLKVSELKLERRPAPGVVNVQLTLRDD